MLLLTRPPYLRWAAAVLAIVAAVVWDLSGRRTEPYPFAAVSIERGATITEDMVRWRDVPTGLLTPADLAGASAATSIAAGDPLSPTVVTSAARVPDGWWSVPISLPHGVSVGTAVKLTFLDGEVVDGVVSLAPTEDSFGLDVTGAVAVPETAAAATALAVATDTVLVVIAP